MGIYHAGEHLFELAGRLLPANEKQRKQWLARCLDRLDKGKIEALVKILRGFDAASPEITAAFATEADYFHVTPNACATRSSLPWAYSSAPASLKRDAEL